MKGIILAGGVLVRACIQLPKRFQNNLTWYLDDQDWFKYAQDGRILGGLN